MGQRWHLTMRCAGGSLASRLYGSSIVDVASATGDKKSSTGPTTSLSLDARYQIAIDVCLALSYLHSGDDGQPQIFHRDLKPDNIMLVRFITLDGPV